MSTITEPPFAASGGPGGARCFHCGEPVPADTHFSAVVDGAQRAMCCAGCAAVTQAIVDSGLADYYRERRELPTGCPAVESVEGLRLYDLPDVQADYVSRAGEHAREVALLLEGVTCAACVSLIERRLARLPGVTAVSINYATRRARIAWDARRLELSGILGAVAEIGYSAHPFDAARSEDIERRERRSLLWRLFVAGFGAMQVMMYAVPAYVAGGDMSADIEGLMRMASLALTLPVVLWAAMPFYVGAWRDLAARRVGMDVPVALAIAVAFAASLAGTLQGAGDVYYDSITMFVFLLLASRYLELMARARAARAQQGLVKRVPAVAERLTGTGGGVEMVAVARLRPGDRVRVRPGGVVPADGTVVDGESALDESLLTGESRPVSRRAGDAVVGGSLNAASPLVIEVKRIGEATVLAGILRLLERAQAGRPRIAQLADRVARWFVAGLLVVAAAAGLAWYAVEPSRALVVVVAVLVVTCPCALSLATPAALTAATGSLYSGGMLVARGHALETLARATHVVFDKTGTLTTGRMALIGVLAPGRLDADACLAVAAGMEAGSEHPIARAIVAEARGRGRGPAAAEDVRNHPGQGIEARVGGARLRIGCLDFVHALHGRPLPQELVFAVAEVGVVALGDERGWLGLFTLGDAPRRDARQAVQELKARGLGVCLLSGDRPSHVAHVARALGIERARGAASPADKLAFVKDLQAGGAVVAMVGDGINDAPVLAQAQVSVAMGGGTELAHVNADMVLLSERLTDLVDALDTARMTLRVIRQNFGWAIAYNALAVPLAVAGWVTPLVAAVGMSGSSLLVVLNALRLARPRAVRGPT